MFSEKRKKKVKIAETPKIYQYLTIVHKATLEANASGGRFNVI